MNKITTLNGLTYNMEELLKPGRIIVTDLEVREHRETHKAAAFRLEGDKLVKFYRFTEEVYIRYTVNVEFVEDVNRKPLYDYIELKAENLEEAKKLYKLFNDRNIKNIFNNNNN